MYGMTHLTQPLSCNDENSSDDDEDICIVRIVQKQQNPIQLHLLPQKITVAANPQEPCSGAILFDCMMRQFWMVASIFNSGIFAAVPIQDKQLRTGLLGGTMEKIMVTNPNWHAIFQDIVESDAFNSNAIIVFLQWRDGMIFTTLGGQVLFHLVSFTNGTIETTINMCADQGQLQQAQVAATLASM